MSIVTQNIANQLRAVRERHSGTTVVFAGRSLKAHIEKTSGANVGIQSLPHGTIGALTAARSPHVFVFSPHDFHPNTDLYAPVAGQTFIYDGRLWEVTDRDPDQPGDDAVSVLIYAYVPVD